MSPIWACWVTWQLIDIITNWKADPGLYMEGCISAWPISYLMNASHQNSRNFSSPFSILVSESSRPGAGNLYCCNCPHIAGVCTLSSWGGLWLWLEFLWLDVRKWLRKLWLIGRRYFEIAIPCSTIRAPSSELEGVSASNQVSGGLNLPLGLVRCTCTIYFPVPGSKDDEWSQDKIKLRKGTSKFRQKGICSPFTPLEDKRILLQK